MGNLASKIATRWLLSGAKTIRDLPQGVFVRVERNGSSLEVTFTDPFGEPLEQGKHPIFGHVEAFPPGSDTGSCRGAYVIRHSISTPGFGPLLYDIAMEAAGAKGLTPDRKQVSQSAYRVWAYYMNNRADVRKVQLSTDECAAGIAGKYDKDLEASPLMKVYYARGTPTINALMASGRWVF